VILQQLILRTKLRELSLVTGCYEFVANGGGISLLRIAAATGWAKILVDASFIERHQRFWE
jgi:hypothetical protein